MGGFNKNKIHYSSKPIDAKESFWVVAPRDGFGSICRDEWQRRMRGTRFDLTPTKFSDESTGRSYGLRYGGAAMIEQGKLRKGFALMGAE